MCNPVIRLPIEFGVSDSFTNEFCCAARIKSMWKQDRIEEDLRELGVRAGKAVLVHASLRSVGKMENGASTLLDALRNVVGENGTILVPAFRNPHSPFFTATEDWDTPPADTVTVGAFAEWVRQQSEAFVSHHPVYRFAAIGANAEFLTRDAPFHHPLGSESPLSRLHQINGDILLLGVNHTVNISLHLAENWANLVLLHHAEEIGVVPETTAVVRGIPGCRNGYGKIAPLLRQSRIAKTGYIGNAPSELLRQRFVVSLAAAMLQGKGSALLCDDPLCASCAHSRKLLAETQP